MTDPDKGPAYDSDKANEGNKVPPPREYYSDRIQDALPRLDEVGNWYQRNERKIVVVAVVTGAYLLNKRAVKKVVTKVIRKELQAFDDFDIQRALSPEWQKTLWDSMSQNAHTYKI